VTADHGNSEHTIEPDGSPNTAHQQSRASGSTAPAFAARGRALGDVAPTLCGLMGWDTGPAMVGTRSFA
jgi:2,3-bisphosphoglycerate-independent phosphoglycerate mutase